MWNICQNGFLLYYCYCQNEIKLIQCVKSQEKKPSVTQQGSCVSLLAEPAVPTAQESPSFVMELKIVASPCWCLASTREMRRAAKWAYRCFIGPGTGLPNPRAQTAGRRCARSELAGLAPACGSALLLEQEPGS